MLGGSSIRLATIFGIRVGVNVSWFLILFLAIFYLQDRFALELGDEQQGFIVAVLTALGFFGSILLHELGHAVAARREDIEVNGIDLFFFGGVMKMSRDTSSPGQEFRVAAAGPALRTRRTAACRPPTVPTPPPDDQCVRAQSGSRARER